MAAATAMRLQTIVCREVAAAGAAVAGTKENVIPDVAIMMAAASERTSICAFS